MEKEIFMNLYPTKYLISTVLAVFIYSTGSLLAESKVINTDAKRTVITNIGLKTPESIEYYAAEDVYLVSNINGSAVVAEGNGFISKIKPDGSVIKLKWIDGTKAGIQLNSPKGIAIQGSNLYVADINQVHIFGLPSGRQKKSITIKGSTFLNGITPGTGDFVYVTDSGLGKGANTPPSTNGIYKVKANGTYSIIVEAGDMGRPNGIIASGKELTVVTFGSGEVYRIDANGKQHTMPAPPKGGLDGLLKLGDGRLLMSSWGESALYVLNNNNSYSILADSLDAPADLGLDTKRQRILIPLFKQNKLVFLQL